MQLNTQPIEKQDLREDGSLDVVSIFPTIQGEGPFAGRPAVFIRLAGCNLNCPFCDTDYTSNRKLMSVVEVVNEVKKHPQINLVVLTGGEPFRQNIVPLLLALNDEISANYDVQIETNGTLWLEDFPYEDPYITIVCSPKTAKIHPHVPVHYAKYILEAGKVDEDGLPSSSLGMSCRPCRVISKPKRIFVQPQDDKDEAKNKANLDAAIASCMKFGYRLSVQQHKAIGLP